MQLSVMLDRLDDILLLPPGGPHGRPPAEEAREGDDPDVVFIETRQSKVKLEDTESGELVGRVYIAPNHLRGSERTSWTEIR